MPNYSAKAFFRIEIDGIPRAEFETCTAPEWDIKVGKRQEGGRLTPHKEPTIADTTPITLTGGLTTDKSLYEWARLCVDAISKRGAPANVIKRNLDIVELDRDGTEKRRWRIYGAFPTKYKTGDWDNTSEELQTEEMTLEYDAWELID